MAWNYNARNKSAEVRGVNYHEDGPNKSSNSTNNKGLNPLGKAIIGGVALFCLGSIGLGWIGEAVGNIKDGMEIAQKVKETEKRVAKDAKKSEKAEKKLADEINSEGYTVKFDLQDLEAGDVQEILEYMHAAISAEEDVEIKTENIIYLDSEVFDNSANYEAAILKRLKYYTEPVAFVIICEALSEKEQDKYYENAKFIINNDLSTHGSVFNDVIIKAFSGTPNDDDLTITLLFSTK